MKNQCKNCRREFIGRPDRKFCTSNCKSTHNNAFYRSFLLGMKNTVGALRRNRAILEKMTVDVKGQVFEQSSLEAEGFDFNFVTGTYENPMGIRAYRLFEYEYFFINEGVLFSKFGN